MKPGTLFAILFLACASLTPAGGQDVTFDSLLSEMTDLDRLADFPVPAFTCRQFSSYDRASTDPAIATESNWFANADAWKFLRSEERNGAAEHVLMDAEGPGAIVRIWSANPDGAGIIRVYLDGAPDPVIEMPLQDMLSGETDLFPAPISRVCAKGWNTSLPIPYGSHCKVTSSKPGFYYHVNYRTYAPGTAVETFSMAGAQEHLDVIRAVAEHLGNPGKFVGPKRFSVLNISKKRLERDETAELDIRAPGGMRFNPFKNSKGGAIYRLGLEAEAENIETALRGTVIEITFDGQATPSVHVPLGDFFGSAPGANPYQSLPSGVRDSGAMYAHWVMPFRKEASIRVTNHSFSPLTLSGDLVVAPREWTERSMYFHAKMRHELNIPVEPHQDWNYIDLRGRGRYVGNMLHVVNPVISWWGEGDEKIYLDGETFPSTFGTGTEDYYGYAWCNPEIFTHAYHNQPRADGPANFGHVCNSRFHILDSLPFNAGLKFDMEVWHHAGGDLTVDMFATSYWYARPGSRDNLPAPDGGALLVPLLPQPTRLEGVLEAEEMRVLSHGGHAPFVQGNFVKNWSNWQAQWWHAGSAGPALELGFTVWKAGRYRVDALLSKGPACGIFNLSVNEADAEGSRDLFAPSWVPGKEQTLGIFDLQAGENVLRVLSAGHNPLARPDHVFLIDYLRLTGPSD